MAICPGQSAVATWLVGGLPKLQQGTREAEAVFVQRDSCCGGTGTGWPVLPAPGPSSCAEPCTAHIPERIEAAAAHKGASERDPEAGTGSTLWAAAGLHWLPPRLTFQELRVPWLLPAQTWSIGMHVHTCEHVCTCVPRRPAQLPCGPCPGEHEEPSVSRAHRRRPHLVHG